MAFGISTIELRETTVRPLQLSLAVAASSTELRESPSREGVGLPLLFDSALFLLASFASTEVEPIAESDSGWGWELDQLALLLLFFSMVMDWGWRRRHGISALTEITMREEKSDCV